MFETIVIGVEGRPQDSEALALGRLLGSPGARLMAAHVTTPAEGLLRPSAPEASAARLAEGQALARAFASARPGVEATATSAESVAAGLRHVAADVRADLIVLGADHHRLPGRFRSGEALCQIAAQAPCAVAVCGRDQRSTGRLARIVVGYDGSEVSETAVRLAVDLAARVHGQVTAVEVVDAAMPMSAVPGVMTSGALPAEHDRVRADLDHLAQEYGLHGIVGIGHAGPALADAARDADLLVTGFHDVGLFSRLLRRSTSHALARDHRTPLLLVPPAATRPRAEDRAMAAALPAQAQPGEAA